jgi:hypothetical protein
MAKKGRQRRTKEQRIARRIHRSELGAGVFRYLTPEQAASPEFSAGTVNRAKKGGGL